MRSMLSTEDRINYQYSGGNMLEKESEMEASLIQGLLKKRKKPTMQLRFT